MRVVLAALLLSACGIRRAVLIESARTARVIDARTGEVICKQTPCRVEAERLWPGDGDPDYKLLRAVAESGATQDLSIDTRRIKDEQTIRFDFEPADR